MRVWLRQGMAALLVAATVFLGSHTALAAEWIIPDVGRMDMDKAVRVSKLDNSPPVMAVRNVLQDPKIQQEIQKALAPYGLTMDILKSIHLYELSGEDSAGVKTAFVLVSKMDLEQMIRITDKMNAEMDMKEPNYYRFLFDAKVTTAEREIFLEQEAAKTPAMIEAVLNDALQKSIAKERANPKYAKEGMEFPLNSMQIHVTDYQPLSLLTKSKLPLYVQGMRGLYDFGGILYPESSQSYLFLIGNEVVMVQMMARDSEYSFFAPRMDAAMRTLVLQK